MALKILYLLGTIFFAPCIAQSANDPIGVHAAAHFGLGQMGTHDASQPFHSIGTFDLQAMPAYRFDHELMAGLLVDLGFHSQLDDAKDSGGYDYSGQSLSFGIGGAYEPGKIKLLLSYDFLARHWVSGTGQPTYRGSGLRFLAGYKFESSWAVDIEIVSSRYNSAENEGIKYGLGEAPISHWNLGFGFSYSY